MTTCFCFQAIPTTKKKNKKRKNKIGGQAEKVGRMLSGVDLKKKKCDEEKKAPQQWIKKKPKQGKKNEFLKKPL